MPAGTLDVTVLRANLLADAQGVGKEDLECFIQLENQQLPLFGYTDGQKHSKWNQKFTVWVQNEKRLCYVVKRKGAGSKGNMLAKAEALLDMVYSTGQQSCSLQASASDGKPLSGISLRLVFFAADGKRLGKRFAPPPNFPTPRPSTEDFQVKNPYGPGQQVASLPQSCPAESSHSREMMVHGCRSSGVGPCIRGLAWPIPPLDGHFCPEQVKNAGQLMGSGSYPSTAQCIPPSYPGDMSGRSSPISCMRNLGGATGMYCHPPGSLYKHPASPAGYLMHRCHSSVDVQNHAATAIHSQKLAVAHPGLMHPLRGRANSDEYSASSCMHKGQKPPHLLGSGLAAGLGQKLKRIGNRVGQLAATLGENVEF